MSGNYFCHVCGGLVDLIKLQPSDVRLCECEKRFARLRTENERMRNTLVSAGYTDEGGGLWKPPLGKSVLPVFEENERLKAELAEAKKDAERLKGLRELCGYVEDGSSQTIRITQDDATRDWIIRWNDKAEWVFSSSFKGAIDEAMKEK